MIFASATLFGKCEYINNQFTDVLDHILIRYS